MPGMKHIGGCKCCGIRCGELGDPPLPERDLLASIEYYKSDGTIGTESVVLTHLPPFTGINSTAFHRWTNPESGQPNHWFVLPDYPLGSGPGTTIVHNLDIVCFAIGGGDRRWQLQHRIAQGTTQVIRTSFFETSIKVSTFTYIETPLYFLFVFVADPNCTTTLYWNSGYPPTCASLRFHDLSIVLT